ncbi:unnamed protein product [Didymodactylos carnosus]|uniref:ATP-dependent DNA helicase n=1 Tax=Didymodactylos carnosus TaxID=1234261 RepID=A0A8S2FN47_9BILA|nr:unnamed protein product [Didymodactylos carnosus]CAF4301871.1 unnamed protein product [Didymodactylos carnosus]
MTLRDRNLLQGGSQSATTIPRGRPLNDRWLFRADHPQYSTHILIRRSFAVVPVLIGPAIPRHDREDTAERYARAILTLFHPWTTAIDICEVNQSWSEALIILQPTFSSKSNKVISNIQLLHECKRDRDDDLFQLVNKPIVSKPIILALLEASMDADQSLINQDMTQHEGLRGRMNREYVDTTIQSVIRSERFSNVSDVSGLSELMTNNSITSSHRTTVDEVVARQANSEDIQQIRGWQHDLKNQKDEIRRTMLFGSREEFSTVKKGCVKILGGAGGCGKSRVIEAISDYMYLQGRLHTVRMLAPSSAAAVGINGLTIQSMLHERRNKSSSGNSQLTQTHMSVVENEWRHIDYCFIDEISMIGCHMLAQFHKITTIAKHTLPTVPFGGINIIFLGDFVQYAPVLDRPLYSNLFLPSDTLSNTIADKPNGRRTVPERDIQFKVGRALCLQVNKVVFLMHQMRNKDRDFMDMQTRLRIGECNDVS